MKINKMVKRKPLEVWIKYRVPVKQAKALSSNPSITHRKVDSFPVTSNQEMQFETKNTIPFTLASNK
jgi:hypothetical protein